MPRHGWGLPVGYRASCSDPVTATDLLLAHRQAAGRTAATLESGEWELGDRSDQIRPGPGCSAARQRAAQRRGGRGKSLDMLGARNPATPTWLQDTGPTPSASATIARPAPPGPVSAQRLDHEQRPSTPTRSPLLIGHWVSRQDGGAARRGRERIAMTMPPFGQEGSRLEAAGQAVAEALARRRRRMGVVTDLGLGPGDWVQGRARYRCGCRAAAEGDGPAAAGPMVDWLPPAGAPAAPRCGWCDGRGGAAVAGGATSATSTRASGRDVSQTSAGLVVDAGDRGRRPRGDADTWSAPAEPIGALPPTRSARPSRS